MHSLPTKKECRVDEQLKVSRLSSIRVGQAHAQLIWSLADLAAVGNNKVSFVLLA